MKVFKSIVYLFIIYNSYAEFNYCQLIDEHKTHYKGLSIELTRSPAALYGTDQLRIDQNINNLILETSYTRLHIFILYFNDVPSLDVVLNSSHVKIQLGYCTDSDNKSKIRLYVNEDEGHNFYITSLKFKY